MKSYKIALSVTKGNLRSFSTSSNLSSTPTLRSIFDNASQTLGVQTIVDWYHVQPRDLQNIITKHVKTEDQKSFIYDYLCSAYPEEKWYAWRFSNQNVPMKFWENKTNQRNYIDWLGNKLGIKTLDDWYDTIDAQLLRDNNGFGLLNMYQGSPVHVLMQVYPEHNWIPWQFKFVPNSFWYSKENQRWFFSWLQQKLGLSSLDAWYPLLNQKLLIENGGRGLLIFFNNSPVRAIMSAYPEHNWLPWKFESTLKDYWLDIQHQRTFFDWLGQQVGVKELDDWYNILSRKLVVEHGGTFLRLYHDSPSLAILAIYPEHDWMPWKFQCKVSSLWNDATMQKKFVEWLGKELGVKELDDWYQVLDKKVFEKHGASTLLAKFNNSPFLLISSIYPEHNWKPWKFQRSTSSWSSQEHVAALLNEVAKELSIGTLDDWYRVSAKQMQDLHVYEIIKKLGGLYEVLKRTFPDHSWELKKFTDRAKKSSQRWVCQCLKEILGTSDIVEDYRHPEILFGTSKRPIQLDVFVPAFSLAFEYQGEQHYRQIGPYSSQKWYLEHDQQKRELCKQHNVTLIEVPYWWDGKKASLAASIQSVRPDVPLQAAIVPSTPIPSNPPSKHSSRAK